MTNPHWWYHLLKKVLQPLATGHPLWKHLSSPEEIRALAKSAGFEILTHIPLFRLRRDLPENFSLHFRKCPQPQEKLRSNLLAEQFIFEFRHNVSI
jgi:hypothetical protein